MLILISNLIDIQGGQKYQQLSSRGEPRNEFWFRLSRSQRQMASQAISDLCKDLLQFPLFASKYIIAMFLLDHHNCTKRTHDLAHKTISFFDINQFQKHTFLRNSCTYQMDGNPGRRFCFAPNNAFKSECLQPTTYDFSEVIKFTNKVSHTLYLYRCSVAGPERVDVLQGEMLKEMATQGFCQKRSKDLLPFLNYA